ncbi:hypothetical protein PHMEG_00037265 [Phytophthora megakarya]|uniref:Ndc10 domain-containing protein n=1 Tax=Phytophthora megakarya TaxID=4795 RepID=A0A225UJG8_9STRA|nr:hypothetical protein PHMEG_00037265 [Phytophthora megakarya]
MSAELDREMSCHFKGLQRTVAAAVSQGRGQIKVGKDPMPFDLYKQVAFAMLKSTSRDMIFARTFMILSWNLMSRAANTVSICYGHLEWREDALCVYFAHMKNDQRGARPRDPRHVYANPVFPTVCPILALGKFYQHLQYGFIADEHGIIATLGVYWATYGADNSDVHLFPGNDEYEPFRKVLGRTLKGADVAAELERRGTAAEDIGTHSMRKGASTYCSSGSTACPPSVAVHLRAGRSMGGVQDRYLRHDAAGDMFVGRTVSGLPILQPEFASLPPRFSSADSVVQTAKNLCFPGIPQNVQFVAEYALASLVYHIDFLRQHLSSDHPLFQSPLFADAELFLQLQSRIKSGSNDDGLQPTGVPPHVKILSEIQSVRNELKEAAQIRRTDLQNIRDSQNMMYDRLISGVTNILEERAIQTGFPTSPER